VVQFKNEAGSVSEYNCEDCKSFMDDFCYKYSFPIQASHGSCTKFKILRKVEDEVVSKSDDKNGLLQEFIMALREANKEIDGKSYIEIYTKFDDLINKFANKLL
jgi:hypothetical protein